MKRRIYRAGCALALSGVLALAGCGGGGDTSSSSAEDQATEATQEAADPAEKFVGDWQLAAISGDGFAMAGDFEGIAEMMETDMSISMQLASDNTGSFRAGDSSADVAWELTGDDTVSLTVTPTDEGSESRTFPATYSEGELSISFEDLMGEEDESDDSSFGQMMATGSMVFTHDGASSAKTFSLADATAITSADSLAGDWTISGLGMFGISFTGEGDKIAEAFGGDTVAKVSFADDGTCTFFDSPATWEQTEDGVVISDETSGISVPVKALGNDIVIDMTDFLGAMMGGEIFLVYSR